MAGLYTILVFATLLSVAYVAILPNQYHLISNKFAVSLLFFTTVGTYITYHVLIYPFFFSPLRHLPEPKGNFLFGHFFDLRAVPRGGMHKVWMNTVPNSGLIRYRHIFNMERIIITSTKGMQEVLTTKCHDFQKASYRKGLLSEFVGEQSILYTDKAAHRAQRRLMAPSFTHKYLRNVAPVFWKYANLMADRITEDYCLDNKESTQTDTALDMQVWSARATLDIIGEAGFSTIFGALSKMGTPINAAYNKLFGAPTSRLVVFLQAISPAISLQPFFLLFPTSYKQDLMDSIALIKDTCKQVIIANREQRKAALPKKEVPIERPGIIRQRSVYDDENFVPQEKTILQTLLSEEIGFTDEVLLSQAMAFLVAGHETTAVALTWAIYELCRNPSLQKVLRNEVRAYNLHDPESNFQFTVSYQELPQLYAFTAEVLRFHPPVTTILREAIDDMTVIGQPIKKGTICVIPIPAINLSVVEWGTTAESFDHTRFLKEEADGVTVYDPTGKAKSTYSNMTFIHGPRVCIGKEFAKEELIILLAVLVGRFEWSFESEGQKADVVRAAFFKKIEGGLPVRAEIVA